MVEGNPGMEAGLGMVLGVRAGSSGNQRWAGPCGPDNLGIPVQGIPGVGIPEVGIPAEGMLEQDIQQLMEEGILELWAQAPCRVEADRNSSTHGRRGHF